MAEGGVGGGVMGAGSHQSSWTGSLSLWGGKGHTLDKICHSSGEH